MPTKKTAQTPDAVDAAYEQALADFAAAIETMGRGKFAEARDAFAAVAAANRDEGMLFDRANSYASVCTEKLSVAPDDPTTAEEQYHRAVLLSNGGEWTAAVAMLDRALASHPNSPAYLYARASAHALNGSGDAAISDLRQAISADPKVRFQAVNDSDFEKIREEPAFIDIIEPTPSGV